MPGGAALSAIVIRPAVSSDRDALVELDLASAAHHAALDPDAYRIPDREAVAAFLDRRHADPDREVFVAVVDGVVVGTVDVTMVEPPDEGSIDRPIPTADIGISVLEGWRGRRIGRLLMEAADGSARARGAEQIVLDLASSNVDALRFYRRLGYVERGLFHASKPPLMPTFDDVRRLSMALPEVEEHVTWGTDVNFRVQNKMFAIGGEGSDGVSIKASLETQAELLEMDPDTFQKSAYVGRFGWVTVDLGRVDPGLLESLLREAWRRTAPKRLAATLEDR